MVGRMPIARQKNGKAMGMELEDIVLEDWNDVMTSLDAECAAWKEIVLNIGNEERIMGGERDHGSR